ncbi:MAG: class I SAM-dependent methyltransferase [Opitutus sp.]|nr:class I SAM-dependent methyltransferase [Opitutus sp.]
MSAPTCRACGSQRVTLRGKKRGAFIPREFEFHACADCGFQSVEPFSGFAIYNDDYYQGRGPDPYVDYQSEYTDYRRTDRLHEFEDLARIAADYVRSSEQRVASSEHHASEGSVPSTRYSPPPLAWLDFGCGAGGFLKFLRDHGPLAGRPLTLSGHDVGSYADLLKNTDRFRILDLEELGREPTASYDVISMIEVVEHLPDPAAALTLVARLLKPGGLLLLTTGNMDSPVARRQGIQYRYCAPEIHVSLFNPRSLARLYARVGLEPHAVRYRGTVRFKVLKTLRHQRVPRALAGLALCLPPFRWAVDWLYGVSAMPCAVKPAVRGQTEQAD